MKCAMFKRYYLAVGFLVLCCVSVINAADVDIEVNTGATYDTNVHRAMTPVGDTYLTLAPKIALKMPLNKLYFGSGMRASMEQHVNMTTANLQEVAFSGIGRFSPSDYKSFGLFDEVVISDRLNSVEKLTDVTNKREFLDNRFLSAFKYHLGRGIWVASLEYASVIRDYRDSEIDDWIVHSMKSQIECSLGHRTSVQFESGIMKKTFEMGATYISIPVTASLKRKLGSKIDAIFSLGLESRGYNEIYRDRNLDEPTASLSITRPFTPNTSSRLSVDRRIYDSDYATGYSFVSTAGDIEMVLNLSSSARLTLQGLYSKNDYAELERIDHVFGGRGELKYIISKWGSVILGYNREWRHSVDPVNDYGKHMIDLSYVVVF